MRRAAAWAGGVAGFGQAVFALTKGAWGGAHRAAASGRACAAQGFGWLAMGARGTVCAGCGMVRLAHRRTLTGGLAAASCVQRLGGLLAREAAVSTRRTTALLGPARWLTASLAVGLLLPFGGPLEAQTGRGFDAAVPGAPMGSLGPATPATPAAPRTPAGPPRVDNSAPVTFTADEVEYDRERGIVTARGRVEAWQNERILRADEFSYDRNTSIATVRGNVQMMEADGQVLFADSAELGQGFRDGVLTGVRALLAANGRMVANGIRRTTAPLPEGAPENTPRQTLSDISRVVYSSCNLCERDPSAPPLWQVRARTATQDTAAQRIAYRDARLEVYGVPVLYTPFFSHPDPQSPRGSGFLFPTVGSTRFLGGFIQTPYYWAIDEQSDLTVTPLFSTSQTPNVGAEYRRRFNSGDIQAQFSGGYFNPGTLGGSTGGKREFAGHIYSRARFHLDENWRVGVEINRASSEQYLRTYRFEFRRVLTSTAFLEGFWGTEGYARIDTRLYQGLRTTDNDRLFPIVGPNAYGEYAPRERYLGGFLQVNTGLLGITRLTGASSQRTTLQANWRREEIDPVGGVWNFRMQGDLRGYYASRQSINTIGAKVVTTTTNNEANGFHGDGNVRAAIDWRMPLVRSAGAYGTQTIEPRIQLVTGPNTGRQTRFPNEDSIDLEFTDANLFNLNRFNGRDRQEGGTRVDGALRTAWDFPNGGRVEAIAGRSWRIHRDATFAAGSGLDRRGSDYVGRLTVAPAHWLDIQARTRLDGETGQHRFSDYIASTSFTGVVPGVDSVGLQAGYLYTTPQPYLRPLRTRNEVMVGVTANTRTASGSNWRIGVSARYDLDIDRPVLVQGIAGYEDECFILEGRFVRRFARDAITRQEYAGNTIFLIRLGFKTLGEYGFRAL